MEENKENLEKENLNAEEQTSEEQNAQNERNETEAEETSNTSSDDDQNGVEKLQIELSASKDKYLRLYSEFENFRRRTAKEKSALILSASEGLMRELLPVLDDFDRAKKAIAGSEDDGAKSLHEGLDLIHNKFFKTLEKQGLKVMESSVGQEFDTDLHEAITQIPAPEEDLKGKVVDEIEKGYLLNDKVLRFAKVVIGA